jgi:predicted polyphosphate/ATP-dependent NAD kinase
VTRVLVCGGRDFTDADRIWSVLDHYHAQHRFSFIIHGGANGADSFAGEWAKIRGVSQMPYLADWNAHGRAAGPRRNARMLAEGKPDVVIAFPGGRGTANMINQADRAGVPVLRVPAT